MGRGYSSPDTKYPEGIIMGILVITICVIVIMPMAWDIIVNDGDGVATIIKALKGKKDE